MKRTMKIVIILSSVFKSITLYSQTATPINDSSIVYMLPYNVDSLLMRSLDTGNYFFYLSGSFKHYEIQSFKISNDISLSDWLACTHRFVFLKQTFYPLLLETDELFGFITNRQVGKIKRFSRKHLLPKYSLTTIGFTYHGEIISSSVKLKK